MKKVSIGNIVNESLIDEMDNICSELLEGDELVKYINAKENALNNLSGAIEKYFENEEEKKGILTFGDFYYRYLSKYGNCYEYIFNSKGYTEKIKELVINSGINVELLNIDWDNFKNKEEKYQELLIDILYAQVNYELGKYDYQIFGLNFGYESVLYFVTTEEKYKRLKENEELIKIFDTYFLETIYGEIYEITGDIEVEGVEIGDFIEKKEGEYTTLFNASIGNKKIENIDDSDEKKVKIIL